MRFGSWPLPAQLGDDRSGLPRRIGEQALESGTKEDALRHQLLRVDPLGDEQRAGPDPAGARDVGSRRIADRENTAGINRAPAAPLRLGKRELIDRPMRLSSVEHLAAEALIERRQRARAKE